MNLETNIGNLIRCTYIHESTARFLFNMERITDGKKHQRKGQSWDIQGKETGSKDKKLNNEKRRLAMFIHVNDYSEVGNICDLGIISCA